MTECNSSFNSQKMQKIKNVTLFLLPYLFFFSYSLKGQSILPNFYTSIYTFDKDGVSDIGGQVYCGQADLEGYDNCYLQELADRNFNLILGSSQIRGKWMVNNPPSLDFMDRIHDMNMDLFLAPEELFTPSYFRYLFSWYDTDNYDDHFYDPNRADDALNHFNTHPALTGYSNTDEPVMYDLDRMADFSSHVKAYDDTKVRWVNLLPIYASYWRTYYPGIGGDPNTGNPNNNSYSISEQSYIEYVESFLDDTDVNFVTIDYYWQHEVNSSHIEFPRANAMFYNYDYIAREANQRNIPYGFILSCHDVNSTSTNSILTHDLGGANYSMFTALAYGSKNLSWFSREAAGFPASSIHNSWDNENAPTQVAVKDRIAEVNDQVINHANILLDLRYQNAYHKSDASTVSSATEALHTNSSFNNMITDPQFLDHFNSTNFYSVAAGDENALLISLAKDSAGEDYFWVVNKHFTQALDLNMTMAGNRMVTSVLEDQILTTGNSFTLTLGPGEGALLHITEASPCNGPFVTTTIQSGTDITWTSDRQVLGNIIVKSNAKLTISAEVALPAGARIIVEHGGELVLDQATLTNACPDKLWEGIHLQSNLSVAQAPKLAFDANQGTLRSKSGTIIQHAENAINTYGGRVFVQQTNFLNNHYNVEMLSYPFTQLSHFWNCKFESNGPLPDPAYPLGTATHVRLWNNHGISFEGNLFQNTASGLAQDDRGTAFNSIDATYTVGGTCLVNTPDNCISQGPAFSNLSRGIVFTSNSGAHSLAVNDNTFDNIIQGILATGGTINVYDNRFINYQGSDTPNDPNFMNAWGVYLDETNGGIIRDNIFESSATSANFYTNYPRGIYVVNTGTASTQLRGNHFASGQMVGINGWHDLRGLQISCNEFDSEFSISIVSEGTTPSLVNPQGSYSLTDPDQAIANQFNYACNDNISHIIFDGINVALPPIYETIWQYFTFSGPLDIIPTCVSSDPSPATSPGYVAVVLNGFQYEATLCNSNSGGGDDDGSRMSGIDKDEIKRAINDLEGQLEKEIQTSGVQLSDWLNMSDDGEVEHGNMLQDYMQLKLQLQQLEMYNEQDLLKRLKTDKTWQKETILTYLNDQNLELWALPILIEYRPKIGANLLETLKPQLESETFNYYSQLLNLRLNKNAISAIPTSLIDALQQLAQTDLSIAKKAKSGIDFFKGKTYVPYVGNWNFDLDTEPEIIKDTEEAAFYIYPNPAQETLWLNCNELASQPKYLEIISITGQSMLRQEIITKNNIQVDVSSLPKGAYLLTIGTIEGQRYTRKFIIQ